MRVACRLSVACKGKHIGMLAVVVHRNELAFEGFGHGFTRGIGRPCAPFGVETTLTIEAVESANLAVCRHKVDA